MKRVDWSVNFFFFLYEWKIICNHETDIAIMSHHIQSFLGFVLGLAILARCKEKLFLAQKTIIAKKFYPLHPLKKKKKLQNFQCWQVHSDLWLDNQFMTVHTKGWGSSPPFSKQKVEITDVILKLFWAKNRQIFRISKNLPRGNGHSFQGHTTLLNLSIKLDIVDRYDKQ